MPERPPTRRDLLLTAGGLTIAGAAQAQELLPSPRRVHRIGVISASIEGRPQRTNGHTWHFAQYFHPEINMAAIRRHQDPGSVRMYERYIRNPRYSFDQLPFPDTRITHIYANPADGLDNFVEAFPGVSSRDRWRSLSTTSTPFGLAMRRGPEAITSISSLPDFARVCRRFATNRSAAPSRARAASSTWRRPTTLR